MQTLIDTQLFKISPQAITEAVKTESGNLLVEGRLQAAETKNGNGRSYPKEILAREVENYKKGPIAENRALGWTEIRKQASWIVLVHRTNRLW